MGKRSNQVPRILSIEARKNNPVLLFSLYSRCGLSRVTGALVCILSTTLPVVQLDRWKTDRDSVRSFTEVERQANDVGYVDFDLLQVLTASKVVQDCGGSTWQPLGAVNPDVWYRKRLSKGNARFSLEEGEVIGPGQYVRLLRRCDTFELAFKLCQGGHDLLSLVEVLECKP